MERRKFLAMTSAATIPLIAGCAGSSDDDDDTNTGGADTDTGDENGNDNGGSSDGNGDDGEPDYGTLDTFEFSGSGDSVESGIELEEGLIVIEATHDGSSNFAIHLIDDDRDHLFVNEIGAYAGTSADSLDYNEYDLGVTADGDWEIEIRQPIVNRGYDLPIEESGEGDSLIGPYEFDGTYTLSADHDGESNFAIHIYPELGRPELVTNEIGAYEGESSVRFDEPGWIAVTADGAWSVSVE
jgi:hypothetical protein